MVPWLHNRMIKEACLPVHTAEVKAVHPISGQLKQIVCRGDLPDEIFFPGEELLFLVGEKQIRRYALSSFDREQGIITVIAYLSGNGPGGRWAASLQPGDVVAFSLGAERLPYEEEGTHHFFFGDATTIGLFNGYKDKILAAGHEYFGVLELDPENEPALAALKLMVDAVPLSGEAPAAAAIQWMEEMHPNCWAAWERAGFYLAGREASVQAFKKYLGERQVAARQIRTLVYWREKEGENMLSR